jgi:hypothetical protein
MHQGESTQTLQLRVSQPQLRYNSPDCPVCHRTVRYTSGAMATCAQRSTLQSEQWNSDVRTEGQRGTGLSSVTPDCPVPHEDKASNGLPAPSPNGRMTWRQQTSSTATIWLVAINTTLIGHFKEGEPKQHSKSYSWHTQALPTTYIHWSILCARFRPLQPTQVPQKES